ncbi:vitamin B12 transport system substrate-binding protein [Vibrio crassostreae]|uniref:vitamin B12 ABC transporter substrate-binding protein BtuF n=1 Tax=Vibrio TaxID=662 RepID=UPI000637984C|nr:MULTISPECIES: vitamin B12 ABC transporter substrate-binding protein BtuF [Vibrio]PMI18167.1 cobalamin-binding protein [Vibrio sp. 10N.286.46.E10]PMJ01541.1 cobalamin-binding protein [Vibrio sp. 10N.286.45.E10]PTO95678.1 vitamin B12 ABC transporter substrate-binding protein BtuF [Vibrio sp. 10N.286.48.B8]PTP04542.1 vitamin B12 ABC transporter substrate-binding protein BtuF [Vibrio sp. 10N.286.45.A3]PTP14900.1 vitamin B12 ABC transporter substrate-binding protein BtuF [Vibrio sp. 10N.286.51.C
MKPSALVTSLTILSSSLWLPLSFAEEAPRTQEKVQPAQRVVSLAPHATELAYSAGLGNSLVAVSERSDYPPQADKLEKVANYQGIKVEKIIALQPDLILAWPAGNPPRELAKLEQFGFNIYYSKTKSLDSIATNIEQLSQYASDPSIGENNAQQYREQLNALRLKYKDAEPVNYFYQLSEKPIITVAQGHWPSEVFEFCGGHNIFEDSASPYPQVGIEQVVLRKPQVIFTSQHAIENGTMWQTWQNEIPAVAQNQIWSLNSDWINRPTTRTLQAIQQVCDFFDRARQNH